MGAKPLSKQQIIMNFTTPPSVDDLMAIARDVLQNLPDELLEMCEDTVPWIEEFPDEVIMQEMDLGDTYDLLALFRSGDEISPGVQKKVANDDDALVLFRRPILDLWCETGDDLNVLVREVIIQELGRAFEFSEDDISEMVARHHQGLLS